MATSNLLLPFLLRSQYSRQALLNDPALVVSLIGHGSNGVVKHDSTLTLNDDDELRQLLDALYAGREAWPRDVLTEWIRTNRFIRPRHHLGWTALRNTYKACCTDVGLLLQALDETEGYILKYVPYPYGDPHSSPINYNYGVLISAMCWAGDGHNFFLRFSHRESSRIEFDDALNGFGRWIRGLVADLEGRCERFDAFLQASNNFDALGLDKDTTTALVMNLSVFVGVPSARDYELLRRALDVTIDMGY